MEKTVVGIRDAKIHLSELIKKVQSGNEVILTDRGKPVGKIISIQPRSLKLEERVKHLEERGILERRRRDPLKKVPPPLPLEKGLARKFLEEDRDR
ncbi:MAG: type II toxin-antitoxin system prevent-host-death family antitoxin [Desulfobacterales bacterium]|nr:type II toxin-antitoxin system prevent-host-death family antitoxin [Desulfobacterales bacterium]